MNATNEDKTANICLDETLKSRMVNAPLQIAIQKIGDDEARFRAEFDLLAENNDDPIGMWLKNIRSRGKVVDENEPIIQLLVELHRKIDMLSAKINEKNKEFLPLELKLCLSQIGHNVLVFDDEVLEVGQKYYARLDIAVFPVRKMPLFFVALDKKIAKIILMHSRDVADFDGYIASRERSIIRENKQRK